MTFLIEVIGIEYIFRIMLGGICGMLIGIERRSRSKEAGTRTHFMVACGASLIMVVSKYAFFDVISQGLYSGVEVRLDPSRVASTIASGIGFLGAGMYSVGIATTLIIIVAQVVLHLKGGGNRHFKTKRIVVKDVDCPDYQECMTAKFNDIGVRIMGVDIDKSGDLRNYIFELEYIEDDIIAIVDYDCSIKG